MERPNDNFDLLGRVLLLYLDPLKIKSNFSSNAVCLVMSLTYSTFLGRAGAGWTCRIGAAEAEGEAGLHSELPHLRRCFFSVSRVPPRTRG